MNKLNKIFLIIIIILVIFNIVSLYLYNQNLNHSLKAAEELYFKTKAVREAGYKFDILPDGSYVLSERTEYFE